MWSRKDDSASAKGSFDQKSGQGFWNSVIQSPSTSDKEKPETNLVPVNIYQIHAKSESDDSVKVGSLSAKIITVVAFVELAEILSTRIKFIVNDRTGPSIEVYMWLAENDKRLEEKDLPVGQYVRVTGAVRSLKGRRYVVAFSLQPIEHLNEITMHLAEVIHASMSVAVMDKQSTSSSLLMASGVTESAVDKADAANIIKLTKPQQLVKDAINNCKDDVGISIRVLHNDLKELSRQSIQEALDFLANEGHVYCTIDEAHFKSTDNI